ncbi:hypothetical protein [Pseudomonas sichuanensis]|uniref:hypothetical protein n=1 Tax=Pseudomonas sichuanensis TaxID=2213015 RepID=UPI00216059C4|nr:hypothetical protein [Pseudomonas sichuanensis]UVL87153.1 hypothetical protein LOY51_15230 [Pseudomonas sichuanensis]
MRSQVRPHSFSGRMGSSLGAAWRNLASKLVSYQSPAQAPCRKFLVMAASMSLCVFGLVAVALSFILLIVTSLAFALVRSWWESAEPVASREESVPDSLGADLYIGDYDSNGHYIGDFKSPD